MNSLVCFSALRQFPQRLQSRLWVLVRVHFDRFLAELEVVGEFEAYKKENITSLELKMKNRT